MVEDMIHRLFLILLFCVFSHSAMADQSLIFKKPKDFKGLEILAYTKDTLGSDVLSIATIDLNDDFIDEYIIRKTNCSAKEFCTFIIAAYMNRKPIILGRFDAHQILVSNQKDYGIRRLIVYNQKNNDFANMTAIWYPNKYKYNFPN